MSHIDYDGISDAQRRESITTFTRLKEIILDAINDGEISPCTISTCFELCPTCNGRGGHSLRFGAISAEQFSEWDEDSRYNYLSGRYDERCEECNGEKVIEVFDNLAEEAQQYLDDYEQGVYESAAERASERAAGC